MVNEGVSNMCAWKVTQAYVPRLSPTRLSNDSFEQLNALLRAGYEPFAVTSHVFNGETIGDTVWVRKEATQ